MSCWATFCLAQKHQQEAIDAFTKAICPEARMMLDAYLNRGVCTPI